MYICYRRRIETIDSGPLLERLAFKPTRLSLRADPSPIPTQRTTRQEIAGRKEITSLEAGQGGM